MKPILHAAFESLKPPGTSVWKTPSGSARTRSVSHSKLAPTPPSEKHTVFLRNGLHLQQRSAIAKLLEHVPGLRGRAVIEIDKVVIQVSLLGVRVERVDEILNKVVYGFVVFGRGPVGAVQHGYCKKLGRSQNAMLMRRESTVDSVAVRVVQAHGVAAGRQGRVDHAWGEELVGVRYAQVFDVLQLGRGGNGFEHGLVDHEHGFYAGFHGRGGE